MNDRFKFRVWLPFEKRMITTDNESFFALNQYGSLLKINDKNEAFFARIGHTFSKENIMQCTGLKDKNGKLIYEGDVVKAKHKPDREGWYCVWRGVVEYDNENCQYVIKASHYSVLNETKLNKATFENNESFIWFDWLEIIGNIYENKDLLNEK